MTRTITVLLIEDSADYAALVQQWLSLRADINFVIAWTDSLQPGLNRLKEGGIDVILLDLGLPDSDGVETFARTKLHTFGVPVILLSGEQDQELALRLVQDGAEDYIAKGACSGDSLAKAIQFAVARTGNRAENAGTELAERPTVIGVMGVKGGVGSTTIACHLACELCRQTGKKTLLADLEMDGGTVAFLMGVESKYSVVDAAVDRLDASLWEGLVSHCPGDLDVLGSPGRPGVAKPNTDKLRNLFALTRKMYRWTILDLGRPSEFSMSLIENVSEVLLVTTTSIPALYGARRTIDTLQTLGLEDNRLKLIVNQLPKTQVFSESELDRFFGVPIYAKFSASGEELYDSCVKNKGPSRNGEFPVQMVALARKMAGLKQEKPRSRLARMFSSSETGVGLNNQSSTIGGTVG